MRQVERSFGRYETGPSLGALDLSAFEVKPETQAAWNNVVEHVQRRERARTIPASQVRRWADKQATPSRAAILRDAKQKAKLAAQAKTVGLNATERAKTAHLQEATPSRPDVRKERLPNSCKERPKVNKGSGKSRSFVPWCSRRG